MGTGSGWLLARFAMADSVVPPVEALDCPGVGGLASFAFLA
jgi:hypothetical protein